mmetsp:Transcript_33332/g.61114  ORF Transcript_33332/g.61114 Transcript_33332/m.61114 type:complete len:110 (-) Transcript_33332:41-370(-)
MHLISVLQSHGLTPHVVSLNAAISSCASGVRWTSALAYMESLVTLSVQPTVITFHELINVLGNASKWELATCAFREMQHHGFLPNVVTRLDEVAAHDARLDITSEWMDE